MYLEKFKEEILEFETFHKIKINPFRMLDSYSCGYWTARVILGYYGLNIENLREDLGTNYIHGTSQNSLIKTLRKRGLKIGLRYNAEPESLLKCVRRDQLVIIYDEKEEHWQVLTGCSEDGDEIITYDCGHGAEFIEPVEALTKEYGSFGIVCKL